MEQTLPIFNQQSAFNEPTGGYSTADILDAFLTGIPAGILLGKPIQLDNSSNFDLLIIKANTLAVSLFAFEQESNMTSQTLFSLLPDLRYSPLFNAYHQLLTTGQPQRLAIYCGHNNINSWFEVSLQKQGDFVIQTFVNINEQKQTEQALANQVSQLQTTLDASINSILLMSAIRDEQGEIIDFMMETANRAVERDLFMQPHDIIGKRLLVTFPGNVESGLFTMYCRVTDTGQAERTVQYYEDSNGLEAWFEVSAVRQDTDRVVLTFMNITDSKRHEQQLEQSNQALEQFAYIASHDLQEPLRKIQAFGDMLHNQYATQLGEGVSLIERMQASASRMSNLIRDLLAYSRLSAPKNTFKPVNLTSLLNEVLTDMELVIQEQQAVIHIGSLPTVKGDWWQLQQLFQNLISNAVKFTHKSKEGVNIIPHIWITCHKIAKNSLPASIKLPVKASSPKSCYWAIDVRDNGIGFDPTYKDLIFQVFQRLHGRVNSYPGTGIGLAIVRRVAEYHGGTVTAQSKEGEGATFTIYLPTDSEN